ncbi:nucleoside hydrolase [Inhella gelatinilytica]|uniref:Nucleoside hydrolase n=1 Tax=Inhella gelatinilytica TaxID=2795030 RepID=A0A931IXK7_9BURK|nr:nucleoside hydrolase [Inhella gelatinilytica]MBH9552929.1 nucleoside hydrolase [Inhella gelatinilytica]
MRLWLDTDPGVDDALALGLIRARPEFELVGLSTVFGNASVAQTTQNALRLLQLLRCSDIPVHIGAAQPLRGSARYAPEVHGGDGVGGIAAQLPLSPAAPQTLPAAEALVAASLRYPRELHLVAVGPFTNVAQALRLDPGLAERVASCTLMGAAFGSHGFTGNVTPCAEANAHNDPCAADEVFAARWTRLQVVPLDATQRVCIPLERLMPLRDRGPVGQLLWQAIQPYAGYYATRDGHAALVAHDATAVAALLMPEVFSWRQGPIRAVEGGLAHGMTVQDWQGLAPNDPAWVGRPAHAVALDAQPEPLMNLCLQAWLQADAIVKETL